MKKIILFSVLAVMALTGCKTQQSPEQAAAEELEQEIWFEKAAKALNDKEFVLEADRIIFKNGRFTYVNANTNFISMHDGKATIQMAFNSPYAGPNGMGGITVDGNASNVKMETDKKGNITYSMTVIGIGVSATVTLQMAKGTNNCTATVSPNFSGNRITFTGQLYEEEDSNVFKGRSL